MCPLGAAGAERHADSAFFDLIRASVALAFDGGFDLCRRVSIVLSFASHVAGTSRHAPSRDEGNIGLQKLDRARLIRELPFDHVTVVVADLDHGLLKIFVRDLARSRPIMASRAKKMHTRCT